SDFLQSFRGDLQRRIASAVRLLSNQLRSAESLSGNGCHPRHAAIRAEADRQHVVSNGPVQRQITVRVAAEGWRLGALRQLLRTQRRYYSFRRGPLRSEVSQHLPHGGTGMAIVLAWM